MHVPRKIRLSHDIRCGPSNKCLKSQEINSKFNVTLEIHLRIKAVLALVL